MEVSRRIISFVLATVMLASVCLCASSCKAKGAAVKTVSQIRGIHQKEWNWILSSIRRSACTSRRMDRSSAMTNMS